MQLNVEEHKQMAQTVRDARAALDALRTAKGLPRPEQKRVITMQCSLAVIQSNLEEKLLREHPEGGRELLGVYYGLQESPRR